MSNTRPQRASLDLLMQLSAELGDVEISKSGPKRGPRELTQAERRHRERREEERQEFAEKMRPHVEPLVQAGYSYRRMARALNEAGIRNSQGGEWHPEALRLTLLPRLGLR